MLILAVLLPLLMLAVILALGRYEEAMFTSPVPRSRTAPGPGPQRGEER